LSDTLDDPFLYWKQSIDFDEKLLLAQSSEQFVKAAKRFFDLAIEREKVARAYYEYSTLMDAFSRVQSARLRISANEFDLALLLINEACNILRSTIHFGFLAPFVSACASAETASLMDSDDPECLQGFKNAIALLEQSKLALSFRDERHFLNRVIDADIRSLISKALLVEAFVERMQGNVEAARSKEERAGVLEMEFEAILNKVRVKKQRSLYIPLDDYQRVMNGAFLVSFPESSNLLLLNIGTNPAKIEKIGECNPKFSNIEPLDQISFNINSIGKGKIRVVYFDAKTGSKFDEGCLTAI
jgi:hypothetical protein